MQYTFVKDIRERRKDEIEQYENKGYLIANKTDYILCDSIAIEIGKKTYHFGIRVNFREIYFYLLHGGSQIYLTVYEIYMLLWKVAYEQKNPYVIENVAYYLKNDEKIKFFYKNEQYSVHKLPDDMVDDSVDVLDSDIKISVTELILLIYLIQDKSNYLVGLSKSKEQKYKNGLVRLLYVLLKCNEKDTILETLGWTYNAKLSMFELRKEKLVGERNKKRYYLTEADERIILSNKES